MNRGDWSAIAPLVIQTVTPPTSFMSDKNKRSELKFLKDTLNVLSEDSNEHVKFKRLRILFQVIGVAIMIVGAVMLRPWSITSIVVMFLLAFGGVFIGIASYMSVNLNQWPFLKNHLNRQSILERVQELEE